MTTLQEESVCDSVLIRVRFLEPRSRRYWGKMNAHEMICHLTDSFRMAMGSKQASPATGIIQRTIMKWGALHSPIPWPRGASTVPELEQGKGGTPPGDFEADRSALIGAIYEFRRSEEYLKTARHPVFGSMTVEEWQRWGYLHVDHHLRQFGA